MLQNENIHFHYFMFNTENMQFFKVVDKLFLLMSTLATRYSLSRRVSQMFLIDRCSKTYLSSLIFFVLSCKSFLILSFSTYVKRQIINSKKIEMDENLLR